MKQGRLRMTRFAMATAAVLLGCGSAYAQARMNVAPLPALGMTSPLGIPNAPVGQTGIPIGATELATPGVSPITSGASPVIGAACAGASSAPLSVGMGSPMTGASAGMASSIPGLSSPALFDGGGMAASAPAACAASAPAASPMGPGSSVGPAGIPLGSTELGSGGISPPSVALSPNPSAPVTSSLPPRYEPALQCAVAPCDVAEHSHMCNDPERCPHDRGSADDVRSAFGRLSPEHGSDPLPLTSLAARLRRSISDAGPPLFGRWRLEMTGARWTDALMIGAVTIMATLSGDALGAQDASATLTPAALAEIARVEAEIDRIEAQTLARLAAPPDNQVHKSSCS